MNSADFQKLKLALRYWIAGMAESDPRYYRALLALDIAEKYHTVPRKDGRPGLSHQVAICQYLRTLHRYFLQPHSVFIVALLHDTYEDYPESEDELKRAFPDEFAMIYRISKVRDGKPISYKQYFNEMMQCSVCSLVKGVDRLQNISSMIGVFKSGKQKDYLNEVDKWFLPMMKHSRRVFPEQEPAYENIANSLVMMQDTIRGLLLSIEEDCSSSNAETV